MKTKINNLNIDLKTVAAIGPLVAGGQDFGRGNRFGFGIHFVGSPEKPFWLNATEEAFDQYALDSDACGAVKARAKDAYNKFVDEWKGVA